MTFDTEVEERRAPSWWLQTPFDLRAEVDVPEASALSELGQYYRSRAEEFRRRPVGQRDDDQWDEVLFS